MESELGKRFKASEVSPEHLAFLTETSLISGMGWSLSKNPSWLESVLEEGKQFQKSLVAPGIFEVKATSKWAVTVKRRRRDGHAKIVIQDE
jgi:hypothetical protein